MKILVIVLGLVFLGCASTRQVSSTATIEERLAEIDRLLSEARQLLLQSGSTEKAIEGYLDPAVERCDNEYKVAGRTVYAARGPTEAMFYLLKSASEGVSAEVVGQTCADALYLRGYASLELSQYEVGETYIKRAIEMSPLNASYLSELGFIFQMRGDWEYALKTFTEAEEHVEVYSPDDLKNQELGRAKRGIGYCLIELGRLDEAETKYEECLEINTEDEIALRQLDYIRSTRDKTPDDLR